MSDLGAALHRRPFATVRFQRHLKTVVVGRHVHYVEKTTSTMDDASSLVQTAASGTVVIADYQSNGVGRGVGRMWSSPAYENLYATFILHPGSIADAVRINLGTAVAVVNAARAVGVMNAGVKWPNDIWVDGKKLAGVLANSDVRRDKKLVMMVGIGINVNETMSMNPNPDVAQSAVSIRTVLEADVDREVLLSHLCAEMETILSGSTEQVLEQYRKQHVLAGANVVVMPRKLEHRDDHYGAVCVGVEPTGELRVRVNGEDRVLASEEVSIRPRIDAWFQTRK